MKIAESRIRQIIREEIEDAPPRSPLGKRAFADQRSWVEPERNTKYEETLFNSVMDHLGGLPLLPRKDCDRISEFMRKGIYSDVFMEPKVRSVYRGINIDFKTIDSMGLRKWYENTEEGGFSKASKEFVLNPKPGEWSSSWSTAPLGTRDDTESVVWNYAAGTTLYGKRGPVGVIFIAEVEKNPFKFFDCEPIYELEGAPTLEDEAEAVGMGPIIVSKRYFWKLSEDDIDIDS